jgi:hypothetical protein
MTTPPISFLCLAPIWNHRQETIETAIQCFLDQTYPHRRLLLIDDRPPSAKYTPTEAERESLASKGIHYLTTTWRFDNLPAKYNYGVNSFEHIRKMTHFAIWDDDDGFAPRHLEAAVEAYAAAPEATWTYPDTVFSTYGGLLRTEPSGGRFWSSITFKKECIFDEGSEQYVFPVMKAIGQDQLFLKKLQDEQGDPARPAFPTYVYRWGSEGENHSSAISTGLMCERWWDVPHSISVKWFEPKYDEFYAETIKEMEAGFPASIKKLP